MSVQVLDGRGHGTEAGIAGGTRWAGDHDPDVINLSLSVSSAPATGASA